ncbi:MAG: threonine ammonia-lyase [Armatimonadota bacterium]
MPTPRDIQAARQRVAHLARVTPLLPISEHVADDLRVSLKLESLQYTGSFKIRGAANALAQLSDDEKRRGVLAASAGNHAQGVAAAAGAMNIAATIVMPETTPLVKTERTRRYGAKVILHGADFEAAYAHAMELCAQQNCVFIHPFADERIIAGQGTVGLELLDQAPYMDSVIVPVGGGGLISGLAMAIKDQRPEVRIFGVQTEAVSPMAQSLARRRLVSVQPQPTIAEGIAVAQPAQLTYDLVSQYVDEIVTVSDAQIAAAMLDLLEDHKLVVEGAGAAPLAALRQLEPRAGKHTVLVISGGNVDVTTLGAVIDRGLAEAGRAVRLRVDLRDHPGALAKLAGVIGETGANIVEIFHNRTTGNIEIGRAEVEVVLTTRGASHVEDILDVLRHQGYRARRHD